MTEAERTAMDAGYAEGVTHTEARASKRIEELAARVSALEADTKDAATWREIVSESRPLYDNKFVRDGAEYTFVGVVDASDDYFYLMVPSDDKLRPVLLSCVGSIETHGFTAVPPHPEAAKTCCLCPDQHYPDCPRRKP